MGSVAPQFGSQHPLKDMTSRHKARPGPIFWGCLSLGLSLAVRLPAAYGADGEPPKTLVIASEGARPPYNYLVGDKLAGFEIDLGRDLCRRMKVSCTFVTQTWDDLIPGLLAQRYDAIMAALEISPQRSAQIAFSIPYVRMPSAFIARKASDVHGASPEDLRGRRIGVERGGTHEAFVASVYRGSIIRRYGTLGDALLDLEAGRIDAAIGDKDALVAFLETRTDARCCHLIGDVPRLPPFFSEGIGVGLRKADIDLRAAFDKAIGDSLADGTFAQISARYFDFPINEPIDNPISSGAQR